MEGPVDPLIYAISACNIEAKIGRTHLAICLFQESEEVRSPPRPAGEAFGGGAGGQQLQASSGGVPEEGACFGAVLGENSCFNAILESRSWLL